MPGEAIAACKKLLEQRWLLGITQVRVPLAVQYFADTTGVDVELSRNPIHKPSAFPQRVKLLRHEASDRLTWFSLFGVSLWSYHFGTLKKIPVRLDCLPRNAPYLSRLDTPPTPAVLIEGRLSKESAFFMLPVFVGFCKPRNLSLFIALQRKPQAYLCQYRANSRLTGAAIAFPARRIVRSPLLSRR